LKQSATVDDQRAPVPQARKTAQFTCRSNRGHEMPAASLYAQQRLEVFVIIGGVAGDNYEFATTRQLRKLGW
jgi:hypothetical protein